MKLVTFAHDGLARLGAVVGNEVVDGSAAPGLPRDMLAFLEAGRSALDGLRGSSKAAGGGSLGSGIRRLDGGWEVRQVLATRSW